ncbi:hypothetical protein [uncultured Algibacter sp.]|uniref:hypothetical protein n=1 Tax=uncultured Algibacter sp. TaxID=298659 RepID=UPI0026205A94|nr:hypothetical protein [uncultured Algibacter sp.]
MKDSVYFKKQPNFFKFKWLINCEYCYGKDFTILRIYISDSLAMEKKIRYKSELSKCKILMENITYGADIKKNNGGVFILAFFLSYEKLVDKISRSTISKEYHNKKIEKWVEFNGVQNWQKNKREIKPSELNYN